MTMFIPIILKLTIQGAAFNQYVHMCMCTYMMYISFLFVRMFIAAGPTTTALPYTQYPGENCVTKYFVFHNNCKYW